MLILPDNSKFALPGDFLNCRVKLDVPVPIEEGAGFVIREEGKTLGYGKVLKLIMENAREAIHSAAGRRMRRT
jgi:translation elongation factor EF-Tu-like GTPase